MISFSHKTAPHALHRDLVKLGLPQVHTSIPMLQIVAHADKIGLT